MKDWLVVISEYTILLIDLMALLVVIYATVEAFVTGVSSVVAGSDMARKRAIWLRFSRWLVAALTFQLAADIVETSISTTWEALGRIAVIALIRTLLNYFLEKDVTELRARDKEAA